MKALTDAVAAGVVTPAPGLKPQPTTPGVVGMSAIPQTPGAAPATPRLKRASEGEEEGPERKRLDAHQIPQGRARRRGKQKPKTQGRKRSRGLVKKRR